MRVIVSMLMYIFCFVLIPSFSEAAETAKIAVIVWTDEEFKQAQYAIEDLNPDNTLMGKPIELLKFESTKTAIGGKLAAQKAVEAGVIAAIVISTSSPSLAMAPVFQEARIPMINAWASNPLVTLEGDYIFRVTFTDPFQARIMSNFAVQDLRAKKAVILTNTGNKYSLALAQLFRQHFQQQGGQILWEGKYGDQTTDFKDLLGNVKTLQPDTVYIAGASRDAGFIIKQARGMGISISFLGSDTWDDVNKYGGEAVNGSYYSEAWHPDGATETLKALAKRYEKKYAKQPEPLVYDAMALLFDSVHRANSLELARIRDAIASTKDFEGATGNITLDENGDPLKSMVILKFVKETPVFVKIVEP